MEKIKSLINLGALLTVLDGNGNSVIEKMLNSNYLYEIRTNILDGLKVLTSMATEDLKHLRKTTCEKFFRRDLGLIKCFRAQGGTIFDRKIISACSVLPVPTYIR